MNDPILEILRSPKITIEDIELLCSGFDPTQQEDIMLAFRILTQLQSYLAETDSWKYSALEQFDFDNQARQFDIDIAVLVGDRSEFLLRELSAWGIDLLKEKVNSLQSVFSDAGTVLTMLVLRIISRYSDLEFKLQLAISRSTLVKIHSELGGLLQNISQEKEGSILSAKYNEFVSQLLMELETTPFEEVQQEMFQVVRDLHSMFLKWADKHSRSKQQRKQYLLEEEGLSAPPPDPPSMESSWSEHFAHMPPPPPSPSMHSRRNSMAPNSSSHRRTFSNSSTFSASTNKTSTSITDELPAMLHAFENAKQHLQPGQTAAAAAAAPERVARRQSGGGASSSSAASNRSRSPVQKFQNYHYTPSPLHQLAIPEAPKAVTPTINSNTPSKDTLEVKMIQNRMMVKVGQSYEDMQEWLNKQNKPGFKPPMVMPVQPPPQSQPSQTRSQPQSHPQAPQKFSLPKKWNTPTTQQFSQNYVHAMDTFE